MGGMAGGSGREVGGAEHAYHRGPKFILRVEGEQWELSWEVAGVLSSSHGEHIWRLKEEEGVGREQRSKWQLEARQKAVTSRTQGLPPKSYVICEVLVAE